MPSCYLIEVRDREWSAWKLWQRWLTWPRLKAALWHLRRTGRYFRPRDGRARVGTLGKDAVRRQRESALVRIQREPDGGGS